MPLVTRQGKGSRLTIQEMDDNLLYLEELAQTAVSGNFEEVTYSELATKIGNSELVTGRYYKITDFKSCYDQPNFDYLGNAITTGNYKEASVSPIIVLAIGDNKLHAQAYQPEFPNDIIKYDVFFNTTEITGGVALGRITERIDEFNNRTDYDHRIIEFRRYRLYYYDAKNQQKTGTIQINSTTPVDNYYTATVIGTGTFFTMDVSVDDIIAIPNMSPYSINLQFCKITSITSDTEMAIEGYSLSTIPALSKWYGTSSDTDLSHKMNNIVGDEVNFNEYTLFGNIEEITEYFNNYFGNTYNLGYDFNLSNNVVLSGPFSNNTFKDGCRNNSFEDDMVENIVGYDFRNNSITNDFDENVINNDFHDNILIQDFQNNIVGSDFYNNLLTGEFRDNQIGEEFHDNMISSDTSDGFWRNQIGNQFYSNIIQTNGNFQNNVVGNGFNNNEIYNDFYKNQIAIGFNNNNIFGNFMDNNIGNAYNNNNIYNDFEDNEIDNYFEGNTIYAYFQDNIIGEGFDSNSLGTISNSIDFERNTIKNGFTDNTISVEFEDNLIENYFKGNIIEKDLSDNGSFSRNQISNNFAANQVAGNFRENEIKNSFILNDVNGDFNYNNIGNGFQDNVIAQNFSFNEIGHGFSDNNIAEGFGFGGSETRGNKIGNNFAFNNVGEYFYDNIVVDRFSNNNIPDYFQFNQVLTNVNSVDFDTDEGVKTFTFTTPNAASDGVYSPITSSGGDGTDASFSVTVTSGVVSNVTLVNSGKNYIISDSLTLAASGFGGTGDITITVSTINTAPMVVGYYNCTILRDVLGDIKLTALDSDGTLYVAPSITSEYI